MATDTPAVPVYEKPKVTVLGALADLTQSSKSMLGGEVGSLSDDDYD